MNFKVNSIDDLQSVFLELESFFNEYKIILLEGEMGSGKTTFIKEYCKHIGIKDEVNSPTFGLVNEYKTANNNTIYHFDLYRVEEEEELYDIGFEEYLDSNCICFIEWPRIAKNFFTSDNILLNLLITEDNKREINVKKQSYGTESWE